MSAVGSSGTARVALALMRPGVALTLLAVTVSGSLVAQSRPIFWSITLLVLVFLMYGATRSLVAPRRHALQWTHLPAALQRQIADTLAALPAGEAHGHLSSVARLADAALANPVQDFDEASDRDLAERCARADVALLGARAVDRQIEVGAVG